MLKFRLVSGLTLFGILCLAVLGWEKWPAVGIVFSLLSLTFVSVGLSEYFAMTKKLGMPGFPKLTMGAALAYVVIIVTQGQLARAGTTMAWADPAQNGVMILFVILGVFAMFKEEDRALGVKSFIASLAGFFYIVWTLGFLLRVYYFGCDVKANLTLGPYLMFFAIMVTKCGDIGGYTFGKLSAIIFGGNHKMVPKLSPGKSWEGFVGCVIFSAGISAGLLALKGGPLTMMIDGAEVTLISYPIALVIGLVYAVVGLAGDLAESALKRAAEVKDSGKILPGMGGMLDALDSLILIAPTFYVFLRIMVLTQ